MTTPATASEPYTEAAPSFKTSTLSRAITGKADVLTNTLPSLAVVPVTVCLLPSNKTKVDERPSPLKLILVLPCIEPEVKESALFSEPESTTILAVISAASTAPIPSIVSLS